GCSLAAAYAFARLTGKRQHEAMAEVDADWLMPRTELLSGAFCESYFWAHAFTQSPQRKAVYAAYLDKAFTSRMKNDGSSWWLGRRGKSAMDLDGLVYCREKLDKGPEIQLRIMDAASALFSTSSVESIHRIMNAETTTVPDEWLYICSAYVGLADLVQPMVTMENLVPADLK
ncbi:MAG: hypothetical protein KAI66_17365, partial [Lentisphaeria bacterium]|nr:hypothetical protein [Lentisphaeria bacterium]